MTAFKTIRARAEKRKGGAEALARMLGPRPDPKALRELGDESALAEMTRRVFSAGFAWSVIVAKWPGFEEAFLGFEPRRLLSETDEFWHKLTMDARIVRNGAKILSVRDNARFVLDVAKEHGSFGKFLADWPPSNEVGLLEASGQARRAARRKYRTNAAEVSRLRRFRHLEGRGRLPALGRPRHRRGADFEARPEARSGAVQRLGEERPACPTGTYR